MGDNHRVSGLLRAVSMTLAAAATYLALPSSAQAADLSACGNIDVSANARCEVVAKGPTCEAKCTPITVQAACEAKLTTDCSESQCRFSASASCQGSCSADCEAQCNVNPPSFSCTGECEGTCQGECNAKCNSSSNKTDCQAACRGTCSGTCNAKCEGTPGSANCKAKCQASCSGSCEASANFDCQIRCQTDGYARCRADIQGGCKARCTDDKVEAALFCDGNYVDVGDNLKNCVDALKNALNIKVSGYAECTGNTCTAEGSASASCAAAPGGAPVSGTLLTMGLGAAIVGIARRRQRRI